MMEKVNSKYKVLFVCLGNICRSPAAHGIFEHIVRENGMEGVIEIDSAGTYSGHRGELPDRQIRNLTVQSKSMLCLIQMTTEELQLKMLIS